MGNVHLLPLWLPTLEQLLNGFKVAGSHPNFRLFLSADPSPLVPASLISRCVRIASDPPSGLKATLKKAICSFSKARVLLISNIFLSLLNLFSSSSFMDVTFL